MKALAPLLFFGKPRTRKARTFLLALAFITFTAPALADDPFDLETSSWMSFDRYKEKPSVWMAPDQREAVEAQPVIAPPPLPPPNMPLITEAPVKPVETPVLPGVTNQGFQVKIDSTEDDNRALQSLLANANRAPDTADEIQPDSKSWKDALAVARSKNMNGDDKTTLGIRFSYLPTIWQPASAPKAVPAKKTEVAQAKPAATVAKAPPPAPKVDPAICAALDAYKKRQLEAIKSDQQTLAALQSAIAQLGLQKQLNFITGANGTLSMQSADGTKPDAASAPAKN